MAKLGALMSLCLLHGKTIAFAPPLSSLALPAASLSSSTSSIHSLSSSTPSSRLRSSPSCTTTHLLRESNSRGLRTRTAASPGPIESSIQNKLLEQFQPEVLEVINESHMHSGPAMESHFKVVVVSKEFEGKNLVARHRLVNAALATELKEGLHALSIVSKTPEQWEAEGGVIPKSPACMGGSKADPSSMRTGDTGAGHHHDRSEKLNSNMNYNFNFNWKRIMTELTFRRKRKVSSTSDGIRQPSLSMRRNTWRVGAGKPITTTQTNTLPPPPRQQQRRRRLMPSIPQLSLPWKIVMGAVAVCGCVLVLTSLPDSAIAAVVQKAGDGSAKAIQLVGEAQGQGQGQQAAQMLRSIDDFGDGSGVWGFGGKQLYFVPVFEGAIKAQNDLLDKILLCDGMARHIGTSATALMGVYDGFGLAPTLLGTTFVQFVSIGAKYPFAAKVYGLDQSYIPLPNAAYSNGGDLSIKSIINSRGVGGGDGETSQMKGGFPVKDRESAPPATTTSTTKAGNKNDGTTTTATTTAATTSASRLYAVQSIEKNNVTPSMWVTAVSTLLGTNLGILTAIWRRVPYNVALQAVFVSMWLRNLWIANLSILGLHEAWLRWTFPLHVVFTLVIDGSLMHFLLKWETLLFVHIVRFYMTQRAFLKAYKSRASSSSSSSKSLQKPSNKSKASRDDEGGKNR